MQDHALGVGDELVIQGHIRLTILAVEGDEVVLALTDEPNGVPGPLARHPPCASFSRAPSTG